MAGRSSGPKGHFRLSTPTASSIAGLPHCYSTARRRSAPRVITHSHDFNLPPLPYSLGCGDLENFLRSPEVFLAYR